MCGKSNKTTSEVKFPEYLETAYRGILGAGKEAVNQPLQQYGGPRQAGFTPMQQQGFSQIAQAQGMGVPYVNAASQAFGQAGQEYNAANLGRYMDPYQQYVIDSTMANIQRSDAIAQNQLKGQGIGAGVSPGLGDRMGLAAAELERNQALARNQRIAEISSQGYTNAQNAFANDASRMQSVGQNYANLGKTAQDLTYQGIGQMLQAGQLQQQQAQTGLDQAYQQFIEQRDYPKSQVEWFANLAYGQPKPTTTTTTTPAPSLISQLAGLGTAAAGLFGAKRGGRISSGRVPRKDYGGGIVPPMLNYEAFRAPAWTYPAFQVPAGAGVNLNSEAGWQINALPQLRWQDLGSPIITQLPKGVSDAFAGIDTSQKKKKAGGGGLAPPGGGGLSRTAAWFAKRNVPLLYAGLGMMAAESPWPLQAIGQGAATGLQAAQKSLELDANPVVDDSGPTIRIWYPSERRWEDTGVPSAKWQALEADRVAAAAAAEKPISVGGNLYNPKTGEWITPPPGVAGADVKTSLVPIWGTDEKGNPMLIQPTETGVAKPMEMPPGFTPSRGIEKIDGGTEWLLYDKASGQIIGRVPKNVAGEAAETVIGTKTGEAAAGLPGAMAAADRMIRAIDDLLADPGLSRITGPVQSWLPNVTGDANRAQSRLDQIMGATFLQAFNDLRGGGQITEREGEKATAAYNRLSSTGMSDEDYVKALKEFREEVIRLVQIAKDKAAGRAAPAPATAPSSPPGGPVYTSPSGAKVFAE